jgi:hypothetical protein
VANHNLERQAIRFFKWLQVEVLRLEYERYSENDIAAFIVTELHRAGLTLQMYEDWKANK